MRSSFLNKLQWQIAIAILAIVLVLGVPSVAFAQPAPPISNQPVNEQTVSEQTGDRQPANIQPYIDGVIDKISEFTLANGMKFIVMERH
ncbi:MAG: hypothetical protein LH679_02225, partial [Cyanobacteria bacterium CAN_BIN43]|nr:hypothetical protein [Cyanobacteria bacterium CAN_BIN43]